MNVKAKARPRRFVLPVLVLAAFAGGAAADRLAVAKTSADSPYDVVEQLGRVLVIVENDYVDPVEREKLIEGAIKGMVAELDPHSTYLPPEDNEIFKGETEGKFGGIGIEVELRDDRLIVVAPIEGSPAERAGIRSGDRILAIGGEQTQGAALDKLVRKMRGDPGTRIDVTVLSPGSDKPRVVTLVREEIKVSSITAKRLAGEIAYVRIKQFQAETHDEFLRAVGRLRAEKKEPIAGVVLDLRSNPGGLVDQATEIADEFLGAGTIYTTRARGRVVEEVRATSGGAFVDLPAVVLVNEYSASASELVAGALQDHKRATLVGAQTFGKGSVQSILELPGGAGLKLTTMRYYTPLGRVIQAAGLMPDIVVEQSGTKTPPEQIVREKDLEGHLPPSATDTDAEAVDAGAVAAVDAGAADAGAETDFGVVKRVPYDPTGGADHVLSVGYQLVKAEAARKK